MSKKIMLATVVLSLLLSSQSITLAKAVGDKLEGTFNAPTGLAFDKSGRFYVSEWGSGRVTRLENGRQSTILEGLPSPAGLAFDDDDNLYIAGYGDGNIYVWDGKSAPRIFASGFSAPTGLLWSGDNNLLVANRNAGEVVATGAGGMKKVISRGHEKPVGIARTDDAKLFVSCYGGSVDIVSPDGSKQSIARNMATPGVGIVPAGPDSVYVVDYAAGNIAHVNSDKTIIIASGLKSPVALATMPDGKLLTGCWGDNSLLTIENPGNNAMKDSRYEKGLAMLSRIDGTDGEAVIESLRDIAPDFGRYLVEFPFGDIYARPGLDVKSREIATVAALTALGNAQPQLKVHISAALNVGCTREEILETIMQMAVYAGFPAALNGLFAAREVFGAKS